MYVFLFQLILLNTERTTKHSWKNEVKRYSDMHGNYKISYDKQTAKYNNIEFPI
jgi:hypothetical protein